MVSRSKIPACVLGQMVALVAGTIVAGLAPFATSAQPLEDALDDCLALEDERARLACFEALARSDDQRSRSAPETASPALSPAPVLENETADSVGRDRFGLPEVSKPKSPENLRREMVLAEARELPRDKGAYIMENGQVWVLASGTYRPVDPGTRVVIEEGVLGSYHMMADGWTYRVRRIR